MCSNLVQPAMISLFEDPVRCTFGHRKAPVTWFATDRICEAGNIRTRFGQSPSMVIRFADWEPREIARLGFLQHGRATQPMGASMTHCLGDRLADLLRENASGTLAQRSRAVRCRAPNGESGTENHGRIRSSQMADSGQ